MVQVYSLLSSSSLQIEYIPDLSQEPVALSAAAAIILPLASLETLSFVVFSARGFHFSSDCLAGNSLPEFCL